MRAFDKPAHGRINAPARPASGAGTGHAGAKGRVRPGSRMGRLARAASLAAVCLVAGVTATRAETPPWQDSPFAYLVKDARLSRVLAGFAQTFALELRLSPGVDGEAQTSNGRLAAATPTDFLNQLCAAHALQWYYQDGVLHVSRGSERVTRSVATRGHPGASLRRLFGEMGLVDGKFGWGDMDDRGTVLVSGPPSYVRRIEEAVASLPDALPDQQVMVFRLRHAPVDDRSIQYRDRQIVTAGVASILRSLVQSGGANAGGTSVEMAELTAPLRAAASTATPAEGQGAARKDEAGGPGAGGAGTTRRAPVGPRGAAQAQGSLQPSIQADSRLNAIIVKDRPQNAPIYQRLIELLDVPSQLVEIEAAIVDVNASQMSELGIDWGARAGRFAGGFGTPGLAPDGATATLIRGTGVGPGTVVPNTGDFLMARIKLLEGKGSARVVSRPSILTQDNLGALIDLSDTFYIQTSGERVASVTPVSVGVSLRVTPRIVEHGGQRSVQLVVDIEDGAIQDIRVGTLPTVRRSTIGTQATVGERESLVIGGLNSEQKFMQKDQVPVLGEIPGLGALFRKSSESHEKRERLFIITPRIVTQHQPPVELQAR